MEDDERIARLRVLVEALGQEQAGAEVHGAPPERGQPLALDPLVADVFRVLGRGDGRDLLVEDDADGPAAAGIEGDLPRRAVEIARRGVPALALAAVHGQLDRVAVRPVEGLVPVEKGLDVVLAGGHLGQAAQRIAEGGRVDDRFGPRLEAVDIDAEDKLRRRAVVDLEPGLGGVARRKEQQHPAVDRGGRPLRGEGDGELDLGAGDERDREQDDDGRQGRGPGRETAKGGIHGNLLKMGTDRR